MDNEPRDPGSFWIGMLLGFTLNLMAMLLFCGSIGVTHGASAPLAFAIGLTQLIYLGPVMIYFKRKGKINSLMGVAVIAGITLLLDTTCMTLAGKL
jgi:hypothetical protein